MSLISAGNSHGAVQSLLNAFQSKPKAGAGQDFPGLNDSSVDSPAAPPAPSPSGGASSTFAGSTLSALIAAQEALHGGAHPLQAGGRTGGNSVFQSSALGGGS